MAKEMKGKDFLMFKNLLYHFREVTIHNPEDVRWYRMVFAEVEEPDWTQEKFWYIFDQTSKDFICLSKEDLHYGIDEEISIRTKEKDGEGPEVIAPSLVRFEHEPEN